MYSGCIFPVTCLWSPPTFHFHQSLHATLISYISACLVNQISPNKQIRSIKARDKYSDYSLNRF